MSIPRAILIWCLLAVAMFANGTVRVVALVPLLGDRTAGVLSVATGVAVVLLVTRPFLRRVPGWTSGEPWRLSLLWLVLTVVFELGLGLVTGKGWSELAGQYAIWRGELWPIVLVAVAAAPFLWARPRAVAA